MFKRTRCEKDFLGLFSRFMMSGIAGAGFLDLGNGRYQSSTFCEFGKSGLVFICEVPHLAGKPDSAIIAACGRVIVAASAAR